MYEFHSLCDVYDLAIHPLKLLHVAWKCSQLSRLAEPRLLNLKSSNPPAEHPFSPTTLSCQAIISSTRSLPIDRNTPIPTRRDKPLSHSPTHSHPRSTQRIPPRQPLHAPNRLLALTMRRHTLPPLHTPHLDLPIQPAAHQILPRRTPTQARNPALMARKVCYLFAGARFVEGNGAGVAGGGEEG